MDFLQLDREHIKRMADLSFSNSWEVRLFKGVWSDNCHVLCQLFMWLCPVGKGNFQHVCSWCTMRKYASQAEKSKLQQNLLLVEVRSGCFPIRSCQSQLKKVTLSGAKWQSHNWSYPRSITILRFSYSKLKAAFIFKSIYEKKKGKQNLKQQIALFKK